MAHLSSIVLAVINGTVSGFISGLLSAALYIAALEWRRRHDKMPDRVVEILQTLQAQVELLVPAPQIPNEEVSMPEEVSVPKVEQVEGQLPV